MALQLTNNRVLICKWFLERFGGKYRSMMPDYRALGVHENDVMLGGVIFDCFYGSDCEVSIAIADKRCMQRRFIRQGFDYPFVQLGLKRISATVAQSNQRSLELMFRLGFKLEGRKRQAREDGDELLFGMLRQECRWI